MNTMADSYDLSLKTDVLLLVGVFEKFLISKYAQIFHALLHSQSHVLEFRK